MTTEAMKAKWKEITRKKNNEYFFAHTRRERLKQAPFKTLCLALWRRFRYFFTFKIPLFNDIVDVRTFWGEKIKASIYDFFDLSRFGFYGGEEMLLTDYYIENLTPEDVFFDVGANYGWYTLVAAKLGARVHAFEPTEKTFNLLKINNEGKSNVILVNKALWKTPGKILFYDLGPDQDVSNTAAESDHAKEVFSTQYNSRSRTIEIPATTIDKYCEESKAIPTFINIDTEGSELNILVGGRETLKKHRPVIALEIWKAMTEDGKCREIIDFLMQFLYEPFYLADNWSLYPYKLEKAEKDLFTLLFLPKVQ
jgi:FkbM family methyltransferase